MWKRVPGIAGKKWLTDKSPHYLDSLEDLHMHTWLATGLMGRVIRSRRTLALVAVLAVLTFALGAAFAQQGQAAARARPAAPTTPPTPALGEYPVGQANLKLPDLSQVSFLSGINGSKLLTI